MSSNRRAISPETILHLESSAQGSALTDDSLYRFFRLSNRSERGCRNLEARYSQESGSDYDDVTGPRLPGTLESREYHRRNRSRICDRWKPDFNQRACREQRSIDCGREGERSEGVHREGGIYRQ